MKNYYGEEAARDVRTGIQMNAFDFVDLATKNYEQLTAMTYFGNEISYAEFKRKVNIYANRLKEYGIEKGDSIGLLLPNTPEIVYYYYAAWVIGATITPLDPRTNPEGIRDMFNLADCKLIVSILDKYVEKISPIYKDLHADKIVIVSPTDEMSLTFKGACGKALYKLKEEKLNLVDRDFASSRVVMNKKFIGNASDEKVPTVYEETELGGMPAACMFTSGSTGTPKAAIHTHEGFNAKAKQIVYTIPNVDRGEKFLGIIPFFSAYGSFAGMHDCLYRGVNMIMIPQFDPNHVPELICEHKPTVLIAVPRYWEDFGDRIDELMAQYGLEDLSFLKYAISGGDKQPKKDVENLYNIFQKYGSDSVLYRGYGSTEVGGPIAVTVYDQEYEDGEYTGVLFPGAEYRFCDPDTHKLLDESATTGELMIHDPSQTIGYMGDDESNETEFVNIDGKIFFKMGDIVSIDEKGRVHFIDRTKRAMMRPDGHTVHATPIEKAIYESPLVDQVCVVGLRKEEGSVGTIPTAFVVLNEGVEKSQETALTIDELALKKLSERNRALAYVFVDRLPMTLMDKVDFKKLEKIPLSEVVPYIVDDTFFKDKGKARALDKK